MEIGITSAGQQMLPRSQLEFSEIQIDWRAGNLQTGTALGKLPARSDPGLWALRIDDPDMLDAKIQKVVYAVLQLAKRIAR